MLIFYKQMPFFFKMYYASEPLSILAFWFPQTIYDQVSSSYQVPVLVWNSTCVRDITCSLYGEWRSSRTVTPSNATLGEVADFLLYVFNLGRQGNTIKGYRSAVAATHSGFADGGSVSDSHLSITLLEGCFLNGLLSGP